MKAQSKNPVQKNHIKYLEKYADDNTDDIYDHANLIAAMEKVLEAKKKEYKEFFDSLDEHPHQGAFEKFLEAARNDWQGEIKDEYNK